MYIHHTHVLLSHMIYNLLYVIVKHNLGKYRLSCSPISKSGRRVYPLPPPTLTHHTTDLSTIMLAVSESLTLHVWLESIRVQIVQV